MLILKKHTGDVLGLKVTAPESFETIEGKKINSPPVVAFAHVVDFFNYPIVVKNDEKPKFYFKDNYYLVDNRSENPLVYKVCLTENQEGVNKLINNIKKSAHCPELLIYAVDSNYRIAVVLDNIQIKDKAESIHKAKEACNFVIGYLRSNGKVHLEK